MTAQTFTVELVGGSARLCEFSVERTHDLTREFRLARTGVTHDASDLPDRFLALVDRLWSSGDGREALVDLPDADGDAVHLRLPVGAEHDALALATLLDEADEYCRAGATLTMPRPPEVVRLRWWQATEAVRQRHGLAPTPFPG
ncbi:MAG TPA: hypothetical protein VF288_02730 [Mycobacteriales bacterium]